MLCRETLGGVGNLEIKYSGVAGRGPDLNNGRACSNEVSEEGVVEDVEVCNEAAIHDKPSLQVVNHTEASAEAHHDVHPIEQACIPAATMALRISINFEFNLI